MTPFRYRRPGSLEEAVAVLRDDGDALILAGGQTLLPAMKHGLATPSQLIDLQDIPGLGLLRLEGDRLLAGAFARHAAVARSAEVLAFAPALSCLAGGIADPLVRAMGTIGGSIANNDPAADYPAALLGLRAEVGTTLRTIPADDFFTGMYATCLEPDEIVTDIAFPRPRRAGYYKLPNPASGYVTVGAFVADFGDGVRVAVNGAWPCVTRLPDAEAMLTRRFDPEAVAALAIDAGDLNNDLHASADYRAHIIPKVIARAVARALI